MEVKQFIDMLGTSFFTGVPDSQLSALSNYLMLTQGITREHILAANEGNCVALAAGYHLATGKIPAVYLQNSGLGNIVNPVASLLNDKVYGIPCIFIVGWRGEPGVHDEPQHIFQGEITLKLLEDMNIRSFILDKDTTLEQLSAEMTEIRALLAKGRQAAFVVRKKALTFNKDVSYGNNFSMSREAALERIIDIAGQDIFVSTTGKTSRELFEIRERRGQDHAHDFLTVGSMGHSSSIALSIALQKPERKVWCLDGDGAAMMHMGAMGLIASFAPRNMVHIVLNNLAYESVGGMPVALSNADLIDVAKSLGYPSAFCVSSIEELDDAILTARKKNELCFIEVRTVLGSRSDLGRPTTTPLDNKFSFMRELKR